MYIKKGLILMVCAMCANMGAVYSLPYATIVMTCVMIFVGMFPLKSDGEMK